MLAGRAHTEIGLVVHDLDPYRATIVEIRVAARGVRPTPDRDIGAYDQVSISHRSTMHSSYI